MNDPPPSCGVDNAVHDKSTTVSPGTALNAPTAYAAVAGVNEPVADDTGPVPAVLIAATVTVYDSPFTNPLIVHGEPAQDRSVTVVPDPTGVATTSYPEIDKPPDDPTSPTQPDPPTTAAPPTTALQPPRQPATRRGTESHQT